MSETEKAELLDWIVEQGSLRVETWYYMGGKQMTSVWTLDDEEKPSGKAETVIEALLMAKQHTDYEATR